MHFSIHTRQADNGFILDVNVSGFRLNKKLKSCYEVYTEWEGVKERVEELVGEFAERLREMIIERPFKIGEMRLDIKEKKK